MCDNEIGNSVTNILFDWLDNGIPVRWFFGACIPVVGTHLMSAPSGHIGLNVGLCYSSAVEIVSCV